MNRQSPLLVAAILLGGLGPVHALGHSHAQTRAKPVRVMPMGDSLTQASPGYRGPLLELLRQAGHEVEFVGSGTGDAKQVASPAHEGHGGFTVGPGKSKADAWADGKGNLSDNVDAWLGEKPDLVLLLVGTNDYFNIGKLQPDYDPDRDGPARLGALLDKIHAASPKSKVLVSSIMPVEWDPDFARKFNQALPKLVEARPFATFVDLNKSTAFKAGDWSEDKLHPTPRGYRKLARGWFEALKAELPPTKKSGAR